MPATARADIDRFLACRRIAVIGLSRNRADYSRILWKALRERGYDLVAVHNSAHEIDGAPCFPTAASISPAPEAALILLPPEKAVAAAGLCADAGIQNIWVRRTIDAEPLRVRGVSVVAGECPFMFLRDSGGIHRFHGWVRQILGAYPA